MLSKFKIVSDALEEEIKNQLIKREQYVAQIIRNLDLIRIGGIKKIALNQKEILSLQDKNVRVVKSRFDMIISYPALIDKNYINKVSDDSIILSENILQQNLDASIFEMALCLHRVPESYISLIAMYDDNLHGATDRSSALRKLVGESNINLQEIKTKSKKLVREENKNE